jgi:protein-S-isoprenylcysteine O-methyltransferase Ste14
MFDRESLEVFLSKVPDLRSPWRVVLTVLYALVVAFLCGAFFYYVNGLTPYAPLISQFVMALVVVAIGYIHFKTAGAYRQRYGAQAYRYYFYHLMIPYLVTWYTCFFHPLFVGGPQLVPWWLAILFGVIFLVLFALASLHIERAGFQMVTHGMDVYTVFPEESTVVHGEIYGYIRHPLYFSLLCGSVALAFFRNNGMALLVALLQLIPALAVGTMEDRELVERAGDEHREYIKKTSALVPVRRLGEFLRFLVFLG